MTSPSHEERGDRALRPGEDPAASARPRVDDLSSEERLEELLAERRRELEEHARRFEGVVADVERRTDLARDARASVERALRVGAADLEAREADLVEFAHELAEREERLRDEEAALARRRSELGAVELKRAALEQREQALAAREAALADREAVVEAGAGTATPELSDETPSFQLLYVPGSSYRLVEIEHRELTRGETFELDEEVYVVARVGASPLPGDRRRCAYLVLGARREGSIDGSV